MERAVFEEMNHWSRGEANEPCRILTDVLGSDLGLSECALFMHVPYDRFRVSSTALHAYCATKSSRLGVFLGRVDLSDKRHVVFGFTDEAARDALLAAEGVITRRPEPSAILGAPAASEAPAGPRDEDNVADF